MALALYRKYRPRTFAEIIGQEHVTEPLMQALRTGRLHHAYLFSGPRGCGKTSSARILARSLNCAKGPTPEPCGECDSCQALAPDGAGSIDVIEIDAASHGGVDDARDLREKAFFSPIASRYKVYVIDEAHMVSPQGFNALLKLVEEPPEYVKFIFATTEPEKVLGTIKSRTHHYPFRLIPPGILRPYLEKLCKEEGVSVEPAVFPLIVRAGGGSARDSLSILDQLIAGAGVYGVTYGRAVALLGVTDAALIDEMTDALAAGDGAAAFGTIEQVVEAGHDPRRFTADLLERLRDLIVLQRVPDAAASGIIEAPDDQRERMGAQASRMGQATLSRMADIAHNGLTEMRGTTAPRLLLELIVARMLLPGAEDSTGALLQRLERMERRLGAASAPVGGPTDQAPPPSAPAAADPPPPSTRRSRPAETAQPRQTPPAPSAVAEVVTETANEGTSEAPRPPVAVGVLDAAAVRRVWDEVLTVVRRRRPKAWAVAREAMVRDVQGDEIVLVFQHAVHANMFAAEADLLVEGIREVIGGSWRVRAELGGDQRQTELTVAEPRIVEQRGGATGSDAAPAATEPPDESPDRSPDRSPDMGGAEEGGWPTTAQLGGPPAAPSASTPPAAAPSASLAGSATDRGKARAGRAGARAPERPTARTAKAPAAPPAAYEGFDPGDEPLDDASDVRETSEEQAIRAITQQFQAERIGGTDPQG